MPHVRTEYDARPAPWRVGLPVNEVTSLPPVASGAFYTGETFWTAAGVAGTVLVGFLAMWTAFRSTHPKRRLNYTVSHQPLVQQVMYGSLEIRWNGAILTDPHVVRLVLTNPGRWDIPSEAFDRGDPFQVDLGVPCLEVLRTEAGPGAARAPQTEVCGSLLRIGPGLIGRGTTITYLLLVDTAPAYDCRHSLVDVKVQQVSLPPPRRTTRPPLTRTP
ncbi:hypothetical protein [Streptomyces sp. NPDC056468]|uniref:hypothetical protein n=1 Tax=Streptomyces sp. NPDC056468 TaxID=3345830 RepID=UPI00368B9F55